MGSTTSSRRRYAPRVPPAQRREQLLDSALALVLADGFHAVTMDGVARACGVTRPVVYGQFADATALLAALLDRSEERALAQLAHVVPALPGPDATGPDPDDLLVDGVTAFLHAVRDDPGTWTVLLLPPQGAPPQLRERVSAKQRLVLGQLRELVAWGVRRRGDDELDVELFARSVHALAEGAARLLLTSPDRFPVERIERFVRTLVRRLGPL
ncbi:TetR/AcrR family transcriptional regulator [Angustibacter speluncae]